MIQRVSNYFAKEYPDRSSLWGRLLFRHGELERKRIVDQWIPSMQDISIIDVGCGDGVFLSSIISGYPKKIVIEDISNFAVLTAYRNINGKAGVVEKYVCNSLTEESGNYNLVLAIGLCDYYPNWEDVIKKLLLRSKECVIVSLPRINHPRNWLRFIWLLLHGIHLQMLNRKRLTNAIVKLELSFEIKRSRFEWFVRILK